MSENAKKKVHAAVPDVLNPHVSLNAANEEVFKLATVHNLETLRSNSAYPRTPSVSPIPTHSASPVVAGNLNLGRTTTEALGGGFVQSHFPVGMGLEFSMGENSNNDDLLRAIQRSRAASMKPQQQGKRKSTRKTSRSRKIYGRSRKIYRR
jgi:hypothetical protein